MSRGHRVLIVSESPRDWDPVRRVLAEHEGFQIAEAASRETFEAALATGEFDVVLTDLGVFGFAGPSILDAIRAAQPRVPVLVVSEADSAEQAVEAMKRGAADYLVKTPHQIQRLPQAIHSALQRCRAEEGRPVQTPPAREGGLHSTFEQAAAGIAHVAPDGRFLRVNRSLCDLLGYTREELLARTERSISHPDDRHADGAGIRRVLAGEVPTHSMETRYFRKDDSTVWAEVTVSLSRDESGAPEYFIGVVSDITRRKRVEAELRESRQVLARTIDSLHSAVFVIDAASSQISNCNAAAERIFGYGRTEMLHRTVGFLHVDEAALAEFREHLRAAVQERGSLSSLEFRMKRKDGTVFPTEHSVAPLEDEEGRRVAWVSVVADITGRKQAVAALRASENRYAQAEMIAHLGHWERDYAEGRAVWSPEALRIFGNLPEAPQRFEDFLRLVHPDDRDATEHAVKTALSTDDRLDVEFRIILADCTERVIHSIGEVRRDASGVPSRMVGMLQDITGRKQAEEALRRSQALLRAILDNIPDPAWLKDEAGHFLAGNEPLARILGRPIESILGRTILDLLSEQGPRFAQQDRDVVCSRKPMRIEERIGETQGEAHWFETVNSPTMDERGAITGTVGIARDITKRKLAEETLAQITKELNAAERAGRAGSWSWNLRTGKRVWSEGMFSIYGRDPEQGAPPQTPWLDHIHSDDRELLQQAIRTALDGSCPYNVDYRIRRCDNGQEATLHAEGTVERDPDGLPLAMRGTVVEVTERRKAEGELKRSREQLRLLAARIQSLREEERTRIAQEIHDELGHALTALKMDIARCGKKMGGLLAPDARQALAKNLKPITESVDQMVETVRRIATELRPAILDHLGLGPAIQWLAQQFQDRQGIRCRVWLHPARIDLDPRRSTELFRMVQELLTNVMRHARATEADIRLAQQEGSVTLNVTDDGIGIQESEAADAGSLGLLGLRERARLLGGEFTIAGSPGKGTTATVRVPVGPAASG